MNNCVGELNYRWFLAFLLSNTVLLLYGVACAASILATDYKRDRLGDAVFMTEGTGVRSPSTPYVVFSYLMFTRPAVTMVGVLCAVMSAVVSPFFGYHLYLAAKSVTTNESVKWRMLSETYEAHEAFHAKSIARMNTLAGLVQTRETAAGRTPPPLSELLVTLPDGARRLCVPPHIAKCLAGECSHPGCAANAEKKGDWPLDLPALPPFPTNFYDLGILSNLGAVFWPLSRRGLGGRGEKVADAAAPAKARKATKKSQ